MDLDPASTTATLEYFQELLDGQFRRLHERRANLDPPAPVFALEHGLDADDVALLQGAVGEAHRSNLFASISRRLWLPFAVHAAEVGYVYDGIEFWPIYSAETPSWTDSEHERDRVRGWLRRFAQEYGGAIPQGAWANTFTKIAWPITHAVLPRYLQVQLAELLSDHRDAWPSQLDDPEALGARLHAWSRDYSDRLEKFCQNTALVGHVAVALVLSGDDGESLYIEPSTLKRLVESLNSERQSRRWLRDARHSAIVRKRHFLPTGGGGARGALGQRSLGVTDPRLQLLRDRDTWNAYAVLPDLRALQQALPSVYDALRTSRAVIAGGRRAIPTGGLLYATAPVELVSWPSPEEPFLVLQGASQEANILIADQCRITRGPWWVFRQGRGEPAVEVKGKFLRPGGRYLIIGVGTSAPDVSWCTPVKLGTTGAVAYELRVPLSLSEDDVTALSGAGLSLVSDVRIRPVGVVPSAWDGEGSVEWLLGDPALLMIEAGRPPVTARIMINGDPYPAEWPPGETRLLIDLDGLPVGVHDVSIVLRDGSAVGREVEGKLTATVRDRHVASPGGSVGEGIRARLVPAQATLPELWNGQAALEAEGPAGESVELCITLRDAGGSELGSCLRSAELPITSATWHRVFDQVRTLAALGRHYDDADSVDISVSRACMGFASLKCERGFQGLRWAISARHEGGYLARLIDRTDGVQVTTHLYRVERPLFAEACPVGQPFPGPLRGGLLWATNGDQTAAQIIPPDPNELMRAGLAQPLVPTGQKSLEEVEKLMVHWRMWRDADLPADPFGARERQRVLDAITSALVAMLASGKWAQFEQRIVGLAPEDVDLDRACTLVGEAPAHHAAAQAIGRQLWEWDSAQALIRGFRHAVAPLASAAGMPSEMDGAVFLLQLASAPGELLDWRKDRRATYLQCVFTDPVLIRAARFAVLGTPNEVAGGVG